MSPRCAPIGFCPLGVVFCACFLPRLWACYTARIPWEIQKGQGFSVHHFPCSNDRNGSSSALYTLVLKVGEGGHSDMNYFTGHDRHRRHSDVVALKMFFSWVKYTMFLCSVSLLLPCLSPPFQMEGGEVQEWEREPLLSIFAMTLVMYSHRKHEHTETTNI